MQFFRRLKLKPDFDHWLYSDREREREGQEEKTFYNGGNWMVIQREKDVVGMLDCKSKTGNWSENGKPRIGNWELDTNRV